MQLSHLDLNLLVALDALLTDCSITAAGRRVHLTQSAMSGALARLREFFGDELLTPVGRKMVRTALGERLTEPVREILLKIRETLALAPTFDPLRSCRRFSIMMSDYVSTVLMPQVLARIQRQAPHVEIEVLSNDYSHPLEILERADVDLVIMPSLYLHKSHPSGVVFDDDYVCVVWEGNQQVGEVLTAQRYFESGHISVQFGRANAPMADNFINAQFGNQRRVEVIAMNFNALIQYVIGTTRIAIAHRRLANYYAAHHPIRLLEPPFAIPRITESMQWHSRFDEDPGSRWLREIILTVANELTTSVGGVVNGSQRREASPG
jgi:LysR family transcriptional regulator, nod-box dependent transcriptional activator